MRRKRHNKDGVFIDLTSLLDIVFIILLIVICNQRTANERVAAQQAENLELKQRVEAQLQIYEDQLETMGDFCMASVNATYDSENITKRLIYIQKNGEDMEEIVMIGNNTSEELKAIENSLKKYIDSNVEKPIILSLNKENDKILYRDEKAILDIFDELKKDYENVYIK